MTGGIIQAVLSIPFDGLLWTLDQRDAERRRRASCSSRSAGRSTAGWSSKPRAADPQPRRAAHPRDDRRRRRDRAVRPGLRGAAYGDIPGAFVSNALAVPLANLSLGRSSRPASPCCGGAHIALVAAFLLLPAVQQAPAHRDGLPEHLLPQARAARRAAQARPRGRGRDVRAQDAPGPRLEGPARRVHLHRVRPLPGGLPGLQHREAAQPQGN